MGYIQINKKFIQVQAGTPISTCLLPGFSITELKIYNNI
jgi:hypothetical protein